jgi:TctA family transporter
VLPGGGAGLAAFSSYDIEKKIATRPTRFGRGAVEGVAGPEAPTTPARRPRSFRADAGIPSNA